MPNVGIVVSTQAALVIDSGLGPRNGTYVMEHAKQLAGDRQQYLTSTHFHPDCHAEIDLGGYRVVLRSVGPAHSAGDQTIFIDDPVLFAGDLLETRMFAICPHFPPP